MTIHDIIPIHCKIFTPGDQEVRAGTKPPPVTPQQLQSLAPSRIRVI